MYLYLSHTQEYITSWYYQIMQLLFLFKKYNVCLCLKLLNSFPVDDPRKSVLMKSANQRTTQCTITLTALQNNKSKLTLTSQYSNKTVYSFLIWKSFASDLVFFSYSCSIIQNKTICSSNIPYIKIVLDTEEISYGGVSQCFCSIHRETGIRNKMNGIIFHKRCQFDQTENVLQ